MRDMHGKYDFNGAVEKSMSSFARGNNNARANKDDEFYTTPQDCVREFSNYDFSGMVVYCDCDNPRKSEVYKYFKKNYSALKLEGLYATWYGKDSAVCYYDGEDEEYFDKGEGEDGSFDSPTSEAVLSKCDVVVTNIPFSNQLPVRFVSLMCKHGMKFLTTTSLSSLAYKGMKAYITSGKLHGGYTSPGKFNRPDGSQKRGPAIWITNMDGVKQKDFYYTGKRLEDVRHHWFTGKDGTKFVNIDRSCDIPDDFNGVMAVPVSFMQWYNERQFDIVNTSNGGEMYIDGKKVYARLYIRRKK